jgi:hypothetical protein
MLFLFPACVLHVLSMVFPFTALEILPYSKYEKGSKFVHLRNHPDSTRISNADKDSSRKLKSIRKLRRKSLRPV